MHYMGLEGLRAEISSIFINFNTIPRRSEVKTRRDLIKLEPLNRRENSS
jgi:hypothetical protein